jgi:hypothetical protein
MRTQIERLEQRLSALFYDLGVAGRSLQLPETREPRPRSIGPRLLTLGELESIRDRLVWQIQAAQGALSDVVDSEERAAEQLEAMVADPRAHRFEVIPRASLGEPGCGAYQVRPRLGLLGMLFDWWCVKLSSGCP